MSTHSTINSMKRGRLGRLSLGLMLAVFSAGLFALPQPVLAASPASNISPWPGGSSCQAVFRAHDGETLQQLVNRSGISWNYGFTWRQVARYNNISSPYTLRGGDSICVPASGTTVRTNNAENFTLSAYVNGGRVYITTDLPYSADNRHFLVQVRSENVAVPQVYYNRNGNRVYNYDERFYYDQNGNIIGKRNGRTVQFDTAYPAGAWWQLGYLRVVSGQQTTVDFNLPAEFRGVTPISVCLKDTATGELFCRSITNTYK